MRIEGIFGYYMMFINEEFDMGYIRMFPATGFKDFLARITARTRDFVHNTSFVMGAMKASVLVDF